jgi:hypothetical protein
LSIAAAHGLPWKKVWEHADNEALRKARKTPNILLPGDELALPEKTPKEISVAHEKRHRFRRTGAIVELRIRLHSFEGPRKDEPYHLEIGDKKIPGETPKTDADGLAVCRVPATATEARLVVGKNEDIYELLIGQMDPIDTVTGLHARLDNMGYDVGGVHTGFDEKSAEALSAFLLDHGVEIARQNVADPTAPDNLDKLEQKYTT